MRIIQIEGISVRTAAQNARGHQNCPAPDTHSDIVQVSVLVDSLLVAH
jgi:hypothetical protein